MLGEKIAKFRHELGLTQKTLAEKLHVTRQTVSKWEQGVSVPDAQMLQKIAENLNVNICDLLEIRLPQDTELEETLRNMAEDEKYRATHYRKVILCTVFLIAVLIVVVVCQMKTILNVREAMEQKFCTAVSSLLLNI